jgi:hypothetical protein
MILHILQMGDEATSEDIPMDVMNHQQAARETQRMQANREELVERIAQAMRQDGTAQPLPGLHPLHRPSDRTTPSRFRPAPTHRADGARAGHERLRFAPPLQGGHGDESLAIPEAAAAPGGPASNAGRRLRRSQCGLPRGLPRRLALQREYKSLFGVPPMRDVQRLREAALSSP